MEIETKIRDVGCIQVTKTIECNENGWGGFNELTLSLDRETNEVLHSSFCFNGYRTSGVDLAELRRFKALLNSFTEL